MFKQNGRFSKIVPKPSVFVGFLDIRSCQPKQTRDMQRIEKSPKNMSKNQRVFLSRLSLFPIIFGTDFQVRNLNVLGKVLGSILASISDHVGVQNDVRTASKTHHEKRCQHEPNMSPNMTPRGLPRRPKKLPKTAQEASQEAT